MNKIIFICLAFIFTVSLSAQESDGDRERIKAYKTAFITEGLNLSPQEAEKFWPIYNDYEQKRRSLYKREHEDIADLQCISEEKAAKMLQDYVEIEKEDYLLKKKFYADLGNIFSAHRIIKLKKVEDDFNRKMIKEYRERRAKEKQS